MKQILSFLLFLLPALAFAQWPAAPNKIRLGNQTTGDGLIVRTDSIPDWTPADRNNAWLAFDTVANLLYFYEGGTWQEYASGGGGGVQYSDSLTTFVTPSQLSDSMAASAQTLSLTDTTLSISGGNSVSLNNIFTAGNGLSKTGNQFKLGGTLTESTTITGGVNSITLSSSNVPIISISSGGLAGGTFESRAASTASYLSSLVLSRQTTGTAAAGLGARATYNLELSDNSVTTAGHLGVRWTNADNATHTSAMDFILKDSGLEKTQMTLGGEGQLSLPQYTTNSFIGTGWARLAVDASGVVVADTTTTGGGGSLTAGRGITIDGGSINLGTLGFDDERLVQLDEGINFSVREEISGLPYGKISVVPGVGEKILSELSAYYTDGIDNNNSAEFQSEVATNYASALLSAETTAGGLNLLFMYSDSAESYVSIETAMLDLSNASSIKISAVSNNNELNQILARDSVTNELYYIDKSSISGPANLAYTGTANVIKLDAGGTPVFIAEGSGVDVTQSGDTLTIAASGGGVSGSGTTGTIPVWSGSTAIGDSPLTVTGTDVTAGGTGFFRPPVGTTAQRPGSPSAGMLRYNTTNGAMEYYGASAWEVPLKSATVTGLGTAGRVPYFDANGRVTNTSNFVFDNTNSQLKIGVAGFTPATFVGLAVGKNATAYNGGATTTDRPTFYGYRYRNTLTSPQTVQDNDYLLSLGALGYDGTQYNLSGLVDFFVDGTPSAGNTPTRVSITTGSNSSNRQERLVVKSDGLIGIGITTPSAKLHVNGSISRNAPVTKTGNFTVADTENWLIVNNASANTTVTLPTASAWTGREIMLKNLSGTYTVISASSNVVPIDGTSAGTAILPATAGAWCTLVSDGTNWVIMQQ